MTRLIIVLGLLLMALAAPRAMGQSSITLRRAAWIEAGGPVPLGKIAALEGEDALALAHVVVLERMSGIGASVSIEDVRRALEGARANWSALTLRGSTCDIRPAEAAPEPRPSETIHSVAPAVEVSFEDDTVRSAVAMRIAQILRADPADLRLSFAAADSELLALPVGQRTLEVRSAGSSDRMALALTLYEQDRIIASKTIRIGVLVRRSVVIAAAVKRRGEAVVEADITLDEQWLGPSVVPAELGEVLGSAVRNRLSAGEIITPSHLTPPVVVRKGDQVAVRCISGSVALMTRGRAMSDAKDGDIIQVQAIEDPERVYSARVDGHGRAVLVAAASTRNRERER